MTSLFFTQIKTNQRNTPTHSQKILTFLAKRITYPKAWEGECRAFLENCKQPGLPGSLTVFTSELLIVFVRVTLPEQGRKVLGGIYFFSHLEFLDSGWTHFLHKPSEEGQIQAPSFHMISERKHSSKKLLAPQIGNVSTKPINHLPIYRLL